MQVSPESVAKGGSRERSANGKPPRLCLSGRAKKFARVYGASISIELGGGHAAQDNRNTGAWGGGICRFRARAKNASCIDHYSIGGRRWQIAERDRRSSLFQSSDCHLSGGREECRLGGRRNPLPDVRINGGHLPWRDQNAERRRGTAHGSRGDGDIEGWERGAIDIPPLLRRCGRRPRPDRRNGTGHREGIVSHSGTASGPEARRL